MEASFEFPSPFRINTSNLGHAHANANANVHGFSYYSSPTASFPYPFHLPSPVSPPAPSCSSSSSSPYTTTSINHILNAYPAPFQQHSFFLHQHPGSSSSSSPISSTSSSSSSAASSPFQRFSSDLPSVHALPEIRPAKNAFRRVAKGSSSRGVEDLLESPRSSSSCCSGDYQNGSPSSEVDFSTEVDVLMKAIQSKGEDGSQPDESRARLQPLLPPLLHHHAFAQVDGFSPVYAAPLPSPGQESLGLGGQVTASGKRRKYHCSLPHCGKSFAQKTHLDIHMRAHTGDKPFICKEPTCGQRFSQLGNLKTHQRRHTGEKPYYCEICHKRFAQRGNVRAHKTTHQQAKPFNCLLDDCGKQFTQLGNLKSHQNKFHAATLRRLTSKFATLSGTEFMSPQDRALWEYFSALYKNSNKGIKGRGKDRKISTTARSDSSELAFGHPFAR